MKKVLLLLLGTTLVGYYDEQYYPSPTIRHVRGTVSLDKQPRFLRITIGSYG